ncbi:MAG: aldehyde ferredoxin oxidoreductase [Chloroflexi bacterium]|nr:aldehyde ferredoxin oxidoreductase [Chloroflexota bacterium]
MATKIPGYHGQLLEIDLSTKSVKKVDLNPDLARKYIGGRAMGGRMLLDAYGTNWGKIDPLSPEAQLFVLAGPYVDFIGCKTNFVFKSPQTNGIVGSQGSGDFIHELRFSGYDGIIFKGKASSPVYVTIFDDKVEIKDASKLWGKEIPETHKMIVEEYGNYTSQYYIGPAGENLVRYACAVTEWYRAAGRGGSGAVMGSKNLKAIVARGTGAAPAVADQKKLNDLMEWARVNLPVVRASTREYGTSGGIFRTGNVSSSEPVKNWQSEWHDQYQIQGQFFAGDQWLRRYWSDYGCTVACSKLGRVKSGKRVGLIAELPDYEAGALEGTNFGIFDINEMLYATLRPDDLGFDLISVGNVCGWACEAQEKGILTAADLGGIQLKWGEADGFVKLMDLIAKRQGEIPKLLGEGLGPTVRKLGKGAEFAMITKDMEWGAHGARSLKDKNEVSYPVSAHGGDHMSNAAVSYASDGKTVAYAREDGFFRDSTGICSFQGLTRDQEIEWLQAITGFGITKDQVEKEMAINWGTMMRVSLLLAGWRYKDDVNPPRNYEPLPDGPYKGMKVDKTIEETKKQQFFAAHLWDKEGVPSSEALKKAGLESFESVIAPIRAKA